MTIATSSAASPLTDGSLVDAGAITPATNEFARAWPVMLASTVGVGLGVTGLAIYSFGLFVLPLAREFGWSRGAISFGVTCLSLTTAVTSPLVGLAIDKWGVRRVAIASQIGLVLGFLILSFVGPSLLEFYALWTMLSVLGSGTSPIVWTRAVAGWFVRRRGLALGMILCGTGLVALLGAPIIGHAVARYGWRISYRLIAAFILLVGVPLTVAFLRSGRRDETRAVSETGVTPREAYRSSTFWRIELSFFCLSIVMGAGIVHLAPLLIDRGLAPTMAASTVGYLGYAIIVGRLSLGALVDRFPPALVGAILISFAAAAMLLLAANMAYLPATLQFGLCAGAEVDLLAFLVSRLFGLKHYAQIYGWGITAFTAGASVGPPVAGYIFDHNHSYGLALYLFAGLVLLSAALILSLGRQLKLSPYAPTT